MCDPSDEKAAISISSGKPGMLLIITANRSGFAVLAETFAKAANAPAGALTLMSEAAVQLTDHVSQCTVPASPFQLLQCVLDDGLSHEVPARDEKAYRRRDQIALLGCAAMAVLAIYFVMAFVRWVAAF